MPHNFTQINRDSFAREDLVREVADDYSECDWCGQKRKSGRLFRYGIWPDGIYTRVNWIAGLFCSVGCMREYHS